MTPPKENSNGAALELVETAYLDSTNEPDISDQWEDWPLQYKCDVRSWLDSVSAAVRQVKAQLDQDIADTLGENNAIRVVDRIYRAVQGGTWKVTENAANDGSLAAWLDRDWVWAVNLRAAGAVTKTRLEAVAKERAQAEDDNPRDAAREAVDQFMTREPSGGPLTVMPVDKAVRFLQGLTDGATLYPPGRKKLGSE